MNFPHIFSPMTIKGVTFKNRILAAPITTNRIVKDGIPTPEGIDVYETKARGGFAQVTITESFIDQEHASRHEHGLDVSTYPMTTFHMESILVLTEAIHAHGAVASIQLNHAGALNHPSTIQGGDAPLGPSAFVRGDGISIQEMTPEMMEHVAENWAKAALNCKLLGFDMINLHGGHGWLLNEFISPQFNHRTDEFGGSMENRARFPIMVCKKIREYCGDDFLLEYRVSGSERVEGGMTIEDGIAFSEIIQEHVDLLHVTSGIYTDHVNSKAFSSMFDPHGCNLDLAEAIKKHVRIPVIAVGGFNSPAQIEEALAAGRCDFAALGRQQIADPEFVNKALTGREDEIFPCLRCSCFNPLPPDPDKREVPALWSCAVNPMSQRELRWRNAPKPAASRKVVVIGGGVSGMFAAYTAAKRGHQVTLLEKEAQLGGLLWFTKVDTHKESLKRYKDVLETLCRRYGVTVKTGTTATKELLCSLSPDVVICANGSHPFVPPIPGIETAHHALYGYQNPYGIQGKRVVIIGGGSIGCETGYFFAEEWNAQVTILEARADLCIDALFSQRIALLPRMEKAGIQSVCSVNINKIEEHAVFYTDSEGNSHRLEADTVLYACGNRANTQEAAVLREAGIPWFVVTGDAKTARTVKQAVYEGFCAAMDIL